MDYVHNYCLPFDPMQSQSAEGSSDTIKEEKVCRLCGESNDTCMPIFENKFSIAEKISRCLPIVVLANDNLPSHICKGCLSNLNISYKLIVNSLRIDEHFRKKFKDKIANQNANKPNNQTNKKHTLITKQNAQKGKQKVLTKQNAPAANENALIENNDPSVIPLKKLRRFATNGPVACEFCDMLFSDVTEFDAHFEESHILEWKCTFCDASYETSEELIAHKTRQHAGNIIICKTCVDVENAEKQIFEQMKKERDLSSGEECDEKFYIPSEIDPKLKEFVSHSKQLQEILPTSEYSANYELRSEESDEDIPFIDQESETTLNPQDVESSEIAETLPSSSTKLATGKQSKLATGKQSKLAIGKQLKNVTNPAKKPASKVKPCFSCKICLLKVNDVKLFELHRKIHLPKPMICVHCKQQSETIYDLYLHKKEVHKLYSKINLKYVCDMCGRFFSSSWEWDVHRKRRCRNRDGNKCKYCDAAFSTSHKLKTHLRKHKQEMIDDPTVEIFKCVSCPKIFVDEEFYQKHRNVHDPECWNKYKCDMCNRSFRDNVRLREHVKSIHEGVKPHICDQCGKSFHRLSNMKAHRVLHFGHNCPNCDQNFEKVRQLINHIQEVHGLEPPANLLTKRGYVTGTHVCKFCGRTLATHQSLLDHEHIHTGEKPYPCEICDKSFRSYTARWSHMQRHKKGNFICEQCGKCFGYKQNLMTHMQIHVSMEERKHECPTCHKRFLRKAHLNVHMRIHEGIRPFTCDICNFSFTQIGDMKRHRARHGNGDVIKRRPRVKVERRTYVSEHSNEDTN